MQSNSSPLAALISRGIIEPEIRIENPVPAPPTEKDDVRTLKAEAAKLRKEKEDLRLELESLKRKVFATPPKVRSVTFTK